MDENNESSTQKEAIGTSWHSYPSIYTLGHKTVADLFESLHDEFRVPLGVAENHSFHVLCNRHPRLTSLNQIQVIKEQAKTA